MGYALRDDNFHTYADYRTWPENVRYELIDGRALLMTPAPSLDHQTLAFEIGRQLGNALEGKPCRVLLAPIDVLLNVAKTGSDDAVDTVVQPDVLVVCDPRKLVRHGVRGAPDWVLEVSSPASASHDQIVKLAAYEKAGVREYWIAHPTDRLLSIYLHDGTAYRRPQILEMVGETPVHVLPGVAIRSEPIVSRLTPYSSS